MSASTTYSLFTAPYCPLVTVDNEPQNAQQTQMQGNRRVRCSRGLKELPHFNTEQMMFLTAQRKKARQPLNAFKLNYLLTFSLQKMYTSLGVLNIKKHHLPFM